MFDVGFSEVLLIAVVALLVLGPQRLPKAARFAGLWLRRARGQWDSVRNELERELAAEELRASVERVRREAAGIARQVGSVEQAVTTAAAAPADAGQVPAAGQANETATTPPAAVARERGDE